MFAHRMLQVLLLGFLAGIAGASLAWLPGRQSALADLAGQKVSLQGYVASDFSRTSNGGKYLFRTVPQGELVQVYGPDWIRPRYGDQLTLTGKLQLPKRVTADGVHVTMSYPQYTVPDQLSLPWHTRAWIGINKGLRAVRDRLSESLENAVAMPAAGYLSGIIFGSRADVAPALADSFAATGTSHILAISGYNITIVAAALIAALAPLGKRRAYWLTVGGVVAFTLMAGASASVVRAAIMGILALTAREIGRRQAAGTAILLSAAVMTAYNPLLLRWDVGFQLSFLALVGIVYIEPLLKRLPLMVATTLAANIAVLPLILWQFGALAVYTLPVNLIVLPLVPVAMALGFVTALVGTVIPFLGLLIGQVAWLVATFQIMTITYAARLPYATLDIRISAAAMLAAYTVLAIWLILQYRSAHARTNTGALEA